MIVKYKFENNITYNERYKEEYKEEPNINKNISNNTSKEKIASIENLYNIIQTTGDGNCLFHSFSQLIFKNENFSNNIRQKICDYYQENNLLDE